MGLKLVIERLAARVWKSMMVECREITRGLGWGYVLQPPDQPPPDDTTAGAGGGAGHALVVNVLSLPYPR
jgi:hypothetical protein